MVTFGRVRVAEIAEADGNRSHIAHNSRNINLRRIPKIRRIGVVGLGSALVDARNQERFVCAEGLGCAANGKTEVDIGIDLGTILQRQAGDDALPVAADRLESKFPRHGGAIGNKDAVVLLDNGIGDTVGGNAICQLQSRHQVCGVIAGDITQPQQHANGFI